MKHTAEQLIIGKAMTGKNFRDALIGVENIAADMGKAHLVDKLQEGDPHTFFEKAAEIFRIQCNDSGGLLQGNRLSVVRIYIVGHSNEACAFRIAETAILFRLGKLVAGNAQIEKLV